MPMKCVMHQAVVVFVDSQLYYDNALLHSLSLIITLDVMIFDPHKSTYHCCVLVDNTKDLFLWCFVNVLFSLLKAW